jgi:hypothetical protein
MGVRISTGAGTRKPIDPNSGEKDFPEGMQSRIQTSWLNLIFIFSTFSDSIFSDV